jgi:hypothetical protein
MREAIAKRCPSRLMLVTDEFLVRRSSKTRKTRASQ